LRFEKQAGEKSAIIFHAYFRFFSKTKIATSFFGVKKMYKENMFTSATDYKDLPSMRIDSRRLIGIAFALTLTLIILVHSL